MIFTSRYSNKELKNSKYMAVRISVGTPKWNLGYQILGEIKELMPFGMMNEHNHDVFKEKYYQRLDGFGVERIRERIENLKKIADELGKDIVLLCYEDVRKENVWCHRLVFAEWWRERTGEVINELADYSMFSEPKEKKNKIEETSLF